MYARLRLEWRRRARNKGLSLLQLCSEQGLVHKYIFKTDKYTKANEGLSPLQKCNYAGFFCTVFSSVKYKFNAWHLLIMFIHICMYCEFALKDLAHPHVSNANDNDHGHEDVYDHDLLIKYLTNGLTIDM